jgi:hypothetical protein
MYRQRVEITTGPSFLGNLNEVATLNVRYLVQLRTLRLRRSHVPRSRLPAKNAPRRITLCGLGGRVHHFPRVVGWTRFWKCVGLISFLTYMRDMLVLALIHNIECHSPFSTRFVDRAFIPYLNIGDGGAKRDGPQDAFRKDHGSSLTPVSNQIISRRQSGDPGSYRMLST